MRSGWRIVGIVLALLAAFTGARLRAEAPSADIDAAVRDQLKKDVKEERFETAETKLEEWRTASLEKTTGKPLLDDKASMERPAKEVQRGDRRQALRRRAILPGADPEQGRGAEHLRPGHRPDDLDDRRLPAAAGRPVQVRLGADAARACRSASTTSTPRSRTPRRRARRRSGCATRSRPSATRSRTCAATSSRRPGRRPAAGRRDRGQGQGGDPGRARRARRDMEVGPRPGAAGPVGADGRPGDAGVRQGDPPAADAGRPSAFRGRGAGGDPPGGQRAKDLSERVS